MKKEELRIGNIISPLGKGFDIVTCIDNHYDNLITYENFADRPIEDFEPVLITEEWLIRLGLERRSLGKEFVWGTKHYMFIDPKNGWHYNFKSDGMVSFIFGKYFVKAIRFVHQLQNFHFEMTEDILEIKN